MPHIDDPLLHAYLDGVCNDARVREIEDHLQGCASCRERLEQARGAAARAHELLATLDAGPVHAPSFEELQARAAAGAAGAPSPAAEIDLSVFATPKRQRQRAPLWRNPALAWAATVMIAFLLGWLSRPGVVVLGPASGADGIERFARAPSGPGAGEPAAPSAEVGAAAQERDDAAAKTVTSADAAGPPAPGIGTEVAGRGAVAADQPSQQESQEALRRAGQQEEMRQRETEPTVGGAAGQRAATAGEPAGPPPAAPIGEAAASAAPLAVESNEAFVDTAMPVAPSVAPGFVTIDRDAVAAFLGTEPRTLPGMAMLRAEVAPGGLVEAGIGQRFALRMIYLAPSGQEIALVQQYLGPLEGQESIAPAEPETADAVGNAAARAERSRDALAFRAVTAAPMTAADLDAAADALDLPATRRDPDGRVTHRWRDGDFVLAISARLDADVVRGLADQVR